MNIKTVILHLFVILISSTVLTRQVQTNDLPTALYCDGIYQVCKENYKCWNNQCIPQHCKNSNNCAKGFQCENSICVPERSVPVRSCSKHLNMEAIYRKKYQKVNIVNWVDPQCADYKFLQLSGNTITTTDWANVFGKNKIVQQYVFTAKFPIVGGEYVSLGIIDTANKDKDYTLWNANRFYYLGYGKAQIGENLIQNQGSKFGQGETVTVVIDLHSGTIKWLVGTQVRYQISNPVIKDKSINWVVYVQLPTNKDFVEISD